MKGTVMPRHVALPAVFLAALFAVPTARAADNYQFMKATDDRVWRLNKETGEITVCTLKGERLICATSAQAASPPPRSYAEYLERQQADRYKAEEKQKADDEKDMRILTRFLGSSRR